MSNRAKFETFEAFYPFYLQEHSNKVCRRLHFLGSSLVLIVLLVVLLTGQWAAMLSLPIIGYGFAWIGHFFFEKNRPATFTHPWYSLRGDWRMFFDMIRGHIPF